MLGISLIIFVLSVSLASPSFEAENLENKKIDSAIIPIEETQAENIKEIAVIPEGGLFIDAKISPDFKKFAYAYKKDNKYFIGTGGAEEQSYKWVYNLATSLDGQRIGYIAQRNARYFMVIDGIEGPEYDDIGYISATNDAEPYYYIKGLNFSLDGRRTAYFNKNAHNIHLVLDGQEGSACDCSYALDPVFSPDSKKIAYAARKNNKYKIVVDKTESELYDRVGNEDRALDLRSDEIILFSPDSKKYAFIAKKNSQEFVVVNGVAGKEYDKIKGLKTGLDNRIFYVAEKEGKQMMVIDEQEGKAYSTIGFLTLKFSADGKRYGYIASVGSQNFLIIDGQEIVIEDGINPQGFVFNADGQNFAYIASPGDNNYFLVANDKKGKMQNYNFADKLIFSPDGTKVAYLAYYYENKKEKDQWGTEVGYVEEKHSLFVNDNEEYKTNGKIKEFKFSPDSRKIAYISDCDKSCDFKSFVVINGKEESKYGQVWNITFSADSKNIFYLARQDNKFLLVINGTEKNLYDDIMAPAFSADGKKILYGARDGNKILTVENNIN